MLAQQTAPTKAAAARQLLQPRQTVKVNYAGPGGYFVSVEGPDQFTICNDDLLTKREAFDLAAQVRAQLVFQRLAREASRDNRTARAMAIVADGLVERGEYGHIVQSQSEEGVTYTVTRRSGCDCPDATYNQPAGGCKHQIAVTLYEKSRLQQRIAQLRDQAAEMEATGPTSEVEAMAADLEAIRAGDIRYVDVDAATLEAMEEVPIGERESRQLWSY